MHRPAFWAAWPTTHYHFPLKTTKAGERNAVHQPSLLFVFLGEMPIEVAVGIEIILVGRYSRVDGAEQLLGALPVGLCCLLEVSEAGVQIVLLIIIVRQLGNRRRTILRVGESVLHSEHHLYGFIVALGLAISHTDDHQRISLGRTGA